LRESYRKDLREVKQITGFGQINYILPESRDAEITELQARPVELWLQSLTLKTR